MSFISNRYQFHSNQRLLLTIGSGANWEAPLAPPTIVSSSNWDLPIGTATIVSGAHWGFPIGTADNGGRFHLRPSNWQRSQLRAVPIFGFPIGTTDNCERYHFSSKFKQPQKSSPAPFHRPPPVWGCPILPAHYGYRP